MTYNKREDGRSFEQLRPIEAKVGVIKNAEGSAYFKIGNTHAYAAVYGPRDLYPKFMQNPATGILRVNYNMMPFSAKEDRVRPGANRRSKEISLVTEKALQPVIDLSEYPNAVVDVFIELPQTDAGSRCAGICAASMALADAGINMKDLVGAIALGKIGDKIVVDLDYTEEAYKEDGIAMSTDIPVAMIPSTGEVSLLQMDGFLTREELKEILKKAKVAIKQIADVQRDAVKKKFEVQAK